MRRFAAHFDARATVILVAALMMLMLLGFARLYTVTNTLKMAQATACQLRRAGRLNTNIHDRVPLRAALSYLADIGKRSATAGTPAQRAAAAAFAARFRSYAHNVQPLPNPSC